MRVPGDLGLPVEGEEHVGRIQHGPADAVGGVLPVGVLPEGHPPLGAVRPQHPRVPHQHAHQQVVGAVGRQVAAEEPQEGGRVHEDVVVGLEHVPAEATQAEGAGGF